MAEFNFGGINEVSAVGSNKSLKPWSINKVSFDGLEVGEIKGKKDPTAVYKTIKMSFSGEHGNFSENLFVPATEDDAKRPVYQNKEGHDYEAPSRFESFKWTLLQLTQVVNPDGYKKLQEQSSKIRGMEDFIKLVVTVANAKKASSIWLKLTDRTTEDGKVYARIPRIVSISKEGELWISDRFVGREEGDLSWSAYELEKKQAYENAKPTDPEKVTSPAGAEAPNTEETKDLDDIDFNSLL